MSGKKAKRYVSDDAQLMTEWNWEKNTEISPDKIMTGSGKTVWWKCLKGHEWQATPNNRTSHKPPGCPYCSNHRILAGFNDLATTNPDLAAEWHPTQNGSLTPQNVTFGSNKKVWWICHKGHEYESSIKNRVAGQGCPYCAGRKVLIGYNDLQTINPTLASEWNYEKNGDLMPTYVTTNSNKKAWWKCRKGHEWLASISNRNNGNGCPICSSERHTSFPEFALLYYLRKYGLDAVHSYRELGYELDIYIPSKRVAIEYDGYYWHKSKIESDLAKNRKCKSDGIKLYRIREGLFALNSSSIDFVIQKNQKDLPETIVEIIRQLSGTSIVVNLERDSISIEQLREYTEKESSILFVNPEIAKEWNYEKNGKLKPEQFAAYSGKKVWWKCSKGHEWQDSLANRSKNVGCPYCAGKRVLVGYNDLQTINPVLSKEWNYLKNGNLKPENVTIRSGKKVWWKCSKGHEWQSRIADRNNRGCPYCAGRYAIIGQNDLQTVNPALAREWNYEKNKGLNPSDVLPGSDKKVWWKCQNGHEWQAVINSRNSGCACPYCAGLHAIIGETDLQTVNPSLAKEWNYEKNDGLTPNDVLPNSNKKIWWKCTRGHEWQAAIDNRNNGHNCPYCSGKKIIAGYNDLKTVNPDLAKEWNYEKNDPLFPEQFTANSGKKVWWKCTRGHEWQATIDSRNSGCGCPYCSGRFVVKGENDLKSINPTLAKEWNYDKNGGLEPDEVMPNSHKKVWWMCSKGHEWFAEIGSRSRGNGCPQCARENRKKY